MTQTTDFIEQLAALADKATPGPWLRSNDPKKWVSTLVPVTSEEWRENADNDAALIVLLRNSIPAILALGRERDALRKALEKIAACTSHNHNWVAGIARQALNETTNEG